MIQTCVMKWEPEPIMWVSFIRNLMAWLGKDVGTVTSSGSVYPMEVMV